MTIHKRRGPLLTYCHRLVAEIEDKPGQSTRGQWRGVSCEICRSYMRKTGEGAATRCDRDFQNKKKAALKKQEFRDNLKRILGKLKVKRSDVDLDRAINSELTE